MVEVTCEVAIRIEVVKSDACRTGRSHSRDTRDKQHVRGKHAIPMSLIQRSLRDDLSQYHKAGK